MSVKDDLIAAKALIDTPAKWRKGNYSNADGQMCALGAINRATAGSAYAESARAIEARIAIRERLPTPYWKREGVAAFNDSKKRTHADIMALFDRAIEAAE